MRNEKRKVYVHCKSGIGRSSSMVIAYLMKYKRMTAKSAHAFVISKRSVIFPEKSPMMKNMLDYEVYLKSRESSAKQTDRSV